MALGPYEKQQLELWRNLEIATFDFEWCRLRVVPIAYAQRRPPLFHLPDPNQKFVIQSSGNIYEWDLAKARRIYELAVRARRTKKRIKPPYSEEFVVGNGDNIVGAAYVSGSLKIGCQVFPWSEVEFVAKKLGWIGETYQIIVSLDGKELKRAEVCGEKLDDMLASAPLGDVPDLKGNTLTISVTKLKTEQPLPKAPRTRKPDEAEKPKPP